MALADAKFPRNVFPSLEHGGRHFLSNIQSDWVVLCTEPETADSPSPIIDPSAVTRAALAPFNTGGCGQVLQLTLRYNTDIGTITSPVIQGWCRDNSGVWERLKDSSGTHNQTLTIDTTNDATGETMASAVDEDGNAIAHDGYRFTDPKELVIKGNSYLLITVHTAFNAGSGTENDSLILGRLIS